MLLDSSLSCSGSRLYPCQRASGQEKDRSAPLKKGVSSSGFSPLCPALLVPRLGCSEKPENILGGFLTPTPQCRS